MSYGKYRHFKKECVQKKKVLKLEKEQVDKESLLLGGVNDKPTELLSQWFSNFYGLWFHSLDS